MDSSTALARQVVESLARHHVSLVVLCPGSRSAPLAYALYDAAQAGQLELLVRHDERVAGFTALGLGRASDWPAAVVTTSGTAVANLHPAVLEAHHAGVPMLILAADRPARLRGTWANQTSDLQSEFFGAATRFAAVLSADDGVDGWREAVDRAMAATRRGARQMPGPALLDLGFDEPLVPESADPWRPPPNASGAGAGATEWWMGQTGGVGAAETAATSAVDLADGRPAVVLAGDGAGAVARETAERLGLPLLAEPSSGARGGPNLVAPYRLLLVDAHLGARVERVLAFGRPTLSRPVTRLLARPDVQLVLVKEWPQQPGPDRADVIEWDRTDLARALGADGSATRPSDSEWLTAWVAAGRLAASAVGRVVDGWPVLTGLHVARAVAEALRSEDLLVAAASNPIRDLDLMSAGWPWPATVFANRGLSGIDGTVSTAIGATLASGASGRVLVGDVAALHDLGALVLGPSERRPDLDVVVVNDGGGGIFSLLEPGADAERDDYAGGRFERVFGTPHRVDFAQVCAGLGVPHVRLASDAGLRERLAEPPRGLRVVEVQVDREDLRPLHDAIGRAVQEAVSPSA